MGRWGGGALALLLLLLTGTPLRAQHARATWVLYDSAAITASALQQQLHAAGAVIRYSSKWLPAISVDANPTALAEIRSLSGVTATRPVARIHANTTRPTAPPPHRPTGTAPSPHRPTASRRADFDSAYYGFNWKPVKALGIPPAHILGFTGEGIRIAILDTGFEPAHEALITRQVAAQRDFINNDGVVSNQAGDPTGELDQEKHGTWVWSILGAFKPGSFVGPAFDATYILAKVDVVQTDSGQLAADEDRWVRAVEWADSMGARIINSSLAFRDFIDKPDYTDAMMTGDATVASRLADEIARRGILLVTAAGNFGPQPTSIGAPADADSVIAVGAVDSLGNPASFSSRGPTADGRLKPELVARGVDMFGANAENLIGYNLGLSGTSVATPLIAGGAAMFMEAWPNLSIMAVRQALLLSGSRAEAPDNNVGYGQPNIASAIFFPEGLITAGITGVDIRNVLTTLQPTFTWIAPLRHPAMRPLYRLQIASDPAFTNVIYTDTITDASSLTLKRPLQPAPQLYWRVIAEAFPGITRTTRASLPFSMPDWVRLTSLNSQSGSITSTTRPTFSWEPLAAPPPIGPLTYDLQILNAQSGAIVQSVNNTSLASVQPPQPLIPNISYRWRVIAKSQVGVADTVESLGIVLVTTSEQPPATLLYQNFPNPFPRADLGQTDTHFWFDVTTQSQIELSIYDLRGRLVRQLVPANASCGPVTLAPGQYGRSPAEADPCVRTSWDARTDGGELVERGVYIVRLRAGSVDQIKKIVYDP